MFFFKPDKVDVNPKQLSQSQQLMFIVHLKEEQKKYMRENPDEKMPAFYRKAGISRTSFSRLIEKKEISEITVDELCKTLNVSKNEWIDTSIKGYWWLIKQRIKEGYELPFILIIIMFYLSLAIFVDVFRGDLCITWKSILLLPVVFGMFIWKTEFNIWGSAIYNGEIWEKRKKIAKKITLVFLALYMLACLF